MAYKDGGGSLHHPCVSPKAHKVVIKEIIEESTSSKTLEDPLEVTNSDRDSLFVESKVSDIEEMIKASSRVREELTRAKTHGNKCASPRGRSGRATTKMMAEPAAESVTPRARSVCATPRARAQYISPRGRSLCATPRGNAQYATPRGQCLQRQPTNQRQDHLSQSQNPGEAELRMRLEGLVDLLDRLKDCVDRQGDVHVSGDVHHAAPPGSAEYSMSTVSESAQYSTNAASNGADYSKSVVSDGAQYGTNAMNEGAQHSLSAVREDAQLCARFQEEDTFGEACSPSPSFPTSPSSSSCRSSSSSQASFGMPSIPAFPLTTDTRDQKSSASSSSLHSETMAFKSDDESHDHTSLMRCEGSCQEDPSSPASACSPSSQSSSMRGHESHCIMCPEWQEVVDQRTAQTYYWNIVTQRTSWKRPEGMLPPDWQALKDINTGKTYYWHVSTNRTSWEPPRDSSASAPDRPGATRGISGWLSSWLRGNDLL